MTAPIDENERAWKSMSEDEKIRAVGHDSAMQLNNEQIEDRVWQLLNRIEKLETSIAVLEAVVRTQGRELEDLREKIGAA